MVYSVLFAKFPDVRVDERRIINREDVFRYPDYTVSDLLASTHLV